MTATRSWRRSGFLGDRGVRDGGGIGSGHLARPRSVDPAVAGPWWLALLFLLIHALGLSGCHSPVFPSRWLDREVVIDGDPRDWAGAVYSLDGERTVVGLRNDDRDLYVCLASSDPNLCRQVLDRGMTLWFDARGGHEKSFGVRFPLGAKEPGMLGRRDAVDRPSGAFIRALRDSTAELEILSGGGKASRVLLAQATGMGLRIGLKEGVLTYEVKIPLLKDDRHPYAIEADRSRPIGLGLETPKFKHSVFERDGEQAMARGGLDEPSGDPSGDPSDGLPDGRPDDSSDGRRGRLQGPGRPGEARGSGRGLGSRGPVQYWLLVRLALDEASNPAVPAER